MPREHEPARELQKPPRGCLLAFLAVLALVLLVLVLLGMAWQPRYPDADPF